MAAMVNYRPGGDSVPRGLVAGGNPPMRPDQANQPTSRAGSGPAPQSNVFIGRLVVVFGTGTGTGIFFYTGTPGPGNPPILAITTASSDPYGNTVTADAITDSGMPFLIYSGPAAAGNLIISIAPSSGTDAYGNNYPEGFAALNSVGPSAQLISGALKFYDAFTLNPSVSSTGTGADSNLILSSGEGTSATTSASLQLYDSTVPGGPLIRATKPLELIGQASAPSQVSDNAMTYASSVGTLEFVSGADGNAYDTGRITLFATGQTVNSATPAAIAGIGITNSVAAGTYHVRGLIKVTQGATTNAQSISFTGPATSDVSITYYSIENVSILVSNQISSLTTMSTGAVPNGTTGQFFFDGKITFSSPGSTFGMECAAPTAADTWTVGDGSYLEIFPVVAS
jgi:hypothetical protein